MLANFIQQHNLSKDFAVSANQYYLPLINSLAAKCTEHDKNTQGAPLFVGLNGCQGSGKSTLVEFLALYLTKQHKLSVAVLSLDDFYLNKEKRQQLAKKVHLLFKTRGVPATHDVALLKDVLQQLKGVNSTSSKHKIISLPRFDKRQDNPLATPYWPEVSGKIDMVLFEGWCWGVQAQTPQELDLAVNDFEKKSDPSAIWRRHVNQSLQSDYQPLYSLFDTWIMLKAPNFHVVYQWRLEQEQKLSKACLANNCMTKDIMSATQVSGFVQHFQRLTECALKELPTSVDILFELDSNRKIIASRGLN